MAEELGYINCGGIPMAIGVQTDMATPALARYQSISVILKYLDYMLQASIPVCFFFFLYIVTST